VRCHLLCWIRRLGVPCVCVCVCVCCAVHVYTVPLKQPCGVCVRARVVCVCARVCMHVCVNVRTLGHDRAQAQHHGARARIPAVAIEQRDPSAHAHADQRPRPPHHSFPTSKPPLVRLRARIVCVCASERRHRACAWAGAREGELQRRGSEVRKERRRVAAAHLPSFADCAVRMHACMHARGARAESGEQGRRPASCRCSRVSPRANPRATAHLTLPGRARTTGARGI